MAAVAFDTLKYVKNLQAAGVPPEQAEAFVHAQQEILSQALDSTLATRADLQALDKNLRADLQALEKSLRADLQVLDKNLRAEIERVDRKLIEHDGDFKVVKWMLGIIVGGVIMLVLKAFFLI